MMGAVRNGSEFAKTQICYLHKQYYRKEYKQLKRFRTISAQEVCAIAKGTNGEIGQMDVARVLTISGLYGIEIQQNCNFFYLYMADMIEKIKESETIEGFSFPEHAFEKAEEQVQDWFEDEMEMLEDSDRIEEFISKAVEYYGFWGDYVDLCNDEFLGYEREYAKAVALFKMAYPKEEIKKEEVSMYAAILRCIGAISGISYNTFDELRLALGIEKREMIDGQKTLYCPEEIVLKKQKDTVKTVEKVIVKEVAKEPVYKEQALLDEIEQLRKKLHVKENENRDLRTKLSENKKILLELDAGRKKAQADHEELVALRNHVYNFTEYDHVSNQHDIAEMKEAIAGLKVTIIGGNDNWIGKLKKEFPGWTFISPNVSGNISSKLAINADKVYFFTDTMSHGTYYRYIQLVREQKIPFGYIHGVNIEANVAQIYREMEKL